MREHRKPVRGFKGTISHWGNGAAFITEHEDNHFKIKRKSLITATETLDLTHTLLHRWWWHGRRHRGRSLIQLQESNRQFHTEENYTLYLEVFGYECRKEE